MVAKIERELLIKDIIADDLQRKKKQISEYDESINKQKEEANFLKGILSSLGQGDVNQIKQMKLLSEELEKAERNLNVYLKTWKSKMSSQKRFIDTFRRQNEIMLREADDMNQIIHEQQMRLHELAQQESEYQMMREQKKLEYQSQLEMMILEREVKDREIQYERIKLEQASGSSAKKPRINTGSGSNTTGRIYPATKESKQIGTTSRTGLKRGRNTKDISMQADSVESEDIEDHMNILLEMDDI